MPKGIEGLPGAVAPDHVPTRLGVRARIVDESPILRGRENRRRNPADLRDAVRQRDRFTMKLCFGGVERLREQSLVPHKQQVTGGVNPRESCVHQQPVRLRVQRTHVNSHVLLVDTPAKKEEVRAIGKELRPAMTFFFVSVVELSHGDWSAPVCRYPVKWRIHIRCTKNDAVPAPAASSRSEADIADRQQSPSVDINSLQLAIGKESDRAFTG